METFYMSVFLGLCVVLVAILSWLWRHCCMGAGSDDSPGGGGRGATTDAERGALYPSPHSTTSRITRVVPQGGGPLRPHGMLGSSMAAEDGRTAIFLAFPITDVESGSSLSSDSDNEGNKAPLDDLPPSYAELFPEEETPLTTPHEEHVRLTPTPLVVSLPTEDPPTTTEPS